MMAYENKFVVSVLVNGRPVREFNSSGKRTATVPFGSEYKIRLINKNNVRAKASVFIDGTDVLCGKKIVLGPYETVDLERFVDDADKGKKFKFISVEQGLQTGEIQDPYNSENGQITVEFSKELVANFMLGTPTILSDHYSYSNPIFRSVAPQAMFNGASIKANDAAFYSSCDTTALASNAVDGTLTSTSMSESTAGATVEGSNSNQKFHQTSDFATEWGTTRMVIYLKGPGLEEKWGIFVNNESSPRAMHPVKQELIKTLSTLVLPDDASVQIKKV